MNIMIAAVGVDPGFAVGRGSADEALCTAAFVVVGLVFLFAARRLCRHHDRTPHVARYTSPRL